MGKRKGTSRPQRLTDYFSQPLNGGRQDGAGHSPSLPHKGDPAAHTATSSPKTNILHSSQQSLHSSSPSGSPAKAKLKLDGGGCSPALSPVTDSGDDTRELPESINTFPTTNQPVLDTVLKDMLVSLRSTIQADMMNCMHRFSGELSAVEARIEHVENKMGDFASTINDLVDANEDREEESAWIKNKIADIEDRSWRNNLKIRGIPESVQTSELRAYVTDLFTAVLPDLTAIDITIDRIHRLPKPTYLPDVVPRDVILRLHFFHVKEQLMQTMRKQENVPSRFQKLQFYADLSQHTLQKRRNLNTITKVLRNHNIPYRWGYPTKISIIKQDKTFVVDSLDKGISLLKEWNILPNPEDEGSPTTNRRSPNPDWKTVTYKNAKSHK